ncbi:MAG: hypothetical protein VB071_11660 [Lawsonibacter sp.]|nr:hypothetical protein [Lawsonibacter sp.]
MSYVNPVLQEKLNSLPAELKNEVLSRNVPLNNLNDIIAVLQQIVDDGEAAP